MKLRDSRLAASTVTATSVVKLMLACAPSVENPLKKFAEQTPTKIAKCVLRRVATTPTGHLCDVATDVIC